MKPDKNPVLSLVTGTRNRPDDFRRLLHSVQAHTSVPWELIVSDASDTPIDETGFPANVIVLPERPRLGHAIGFNRAFRRTRGKWAIFVNDDCEVLHGYASIAIDFMERNPQIGLGALPYSNKGGSFGVNEYEGMVYANFGIMSTELGNRIGWLDEEIAMYGSDNSLSFRVLLAGFGISEIPGARVIHHETHDHHRVENQIGRHAEADKLRAKYLPHIERMRGVYERCRLVTA